MYAERNSQQDNNTLHRLDRNVNPHDGTSNQHLEQQPMHCANCDIDFLWAPTIVQGKTYCCTGCAAGGPCNCDYSQYRSVNISGVIHYEREVWGTSYGPQQE